ncbi:MAG: sigma-54-dependent Fis family transcriptional regulator [Burkholderiales bacterium]|nr:sigma-54-dependent Fis family transcriptional regulator [Burkholderiales bacterium]
MATGQVLVVDDEADIRELLGMTLIRMGLEPRCAGSVSEALSLLGGNNFELCLTDMRLSDGDGLSIVEHITRHHPSLPVAVITAHGSAENAVAALKAGAFDYLGKPVSLDQLRALVRSALKLPRPGAERRDGDSAAQPAAGMPHLIGESVQMAQARELIGKLARSQAPVQIRGESGSGKELAARLIHFNSARREGPFLAVNCGAIPENLMESEFFGHRKGAFTGALADHDGFFQAASGGTLFLDEVGDLPLSMQVKLLRAIQEKRVRKVGSTSEEPVDVRIISATHRHLADEVKSGAFRQDLYYRLNVIELRMPALRELREDIPRLSAAILERHANEGRVPRLSAAAVAALQGYHFPGNVRELENILERAVALSSGNEIGVEDLQLSQEGAVAQDMDIDGLPLPERLEAIERKAIIDALERARYNQTAAAKLLGISFRALRYRIQRLGIRQELDAKP